MPTTSLYMNRRQFVTAVIASALPLFAMTPVIARASSSGDIPWYINGECYYNSSSVSSSGNYVNSYAFIRAPRTLPAGWLGAYSVLYNINGAAVASNISYSPSACPGYGTGTSAAKISGMSYRSLAYTYVYNQSSGGYYESGAVWSPYQTVYNLNPYQYNESGQSYGPIDGFLSTGYYPDLVLVRGISGVDGYVYKNDFLCHSAASPEEAIAYYSASSSYTVDVYASDGITWVDSYEIQVGGGEAM